MAYLPLNLQMFTAAFAGALAGMGASGRFPTDPVAADYAGLSSVAGAFAQAFDTAWGITPVSLLEVESAQELCEVVWQDRSPQTVPPFTTPSTYTVEATALVAMIQAGSIYFVGQGIVPPPVPGGGGGSGTTVANIAAFAAINDALLTDETSLLCLTLWQSFTLDKTSTVAVDGITSLATMSGTGRWLRDLTPVPHWTNQSTYEVNSATGNDENPGTTALPLKTAAEFTRRTVFAKYSNNFIPAYNLIAQNDIPITDSLQWSPQIQSTGPIAGASFGISGRSLTITCKKTVAGSGAVLAFVAPVGNAVCTVSRVAGVFAAGDLIEFTSGPATGIRVAIQTAGAVGQVNPYVFGDPAYGAPTYPAPGDTFNIVTLSKWEPEINGVGGIQGQVIRLIDANIPSTSPGWEVLNMQLTLSGCLVQTSVKPGNGGRLRLDGGTAFFFPAYVGAPPAANFYSVVRGSVVSVTPTTWINVIFELFDIGGTAYLWENEFQNGCVRIGGAGEIGLFNLGACTALFYNLRCFEYPTTVSVSPLGDPGGLGDAGAALIMKRGATCQVTGVTLGGLVGSSTFAGTSGLNISESSMCLINGPTPTATGMVSNIIMDGGAVIPIITAVTGVPAAGAALTAWTGAGGWDDAATYNKNAMNLTNGTRIVKAA